MNNLNTLTSYNSTFNISNRPKLNPQKSRHFQTINTNYTSNTLHTNNSKGNLRILHTSNSDYKRTNATQSQNPKQTSQKNSFHFEGKKLDIWDKEHIEIENPNKGFNQIIKSVPKNSKAHLFLQNARECSENSKLLNRGAHTNIIKNDFLISMKNKSILPRFNFDSFLKKSKDNKFNESTITANTNSKEMIDKQINKPEGYQKIIKERIKNENYNLKEGMSIVLQISLKKIEKQKYREILNELYYSGDKARTEHSLQIDMLKVQAKKIEDNFLKFKNTFTSFKSLPSKEETTPIGNKKNNTDDSPDFPIHTRSRYASTKFLSGIIIQAKMQKQVQASGKANSIENCKQEYNENYEKIREEFYNLIARCKDKLNSIDTIEKYLKLVYQTVGKEQKTYYCDILKLGKDTRKNGLVWVVKKGIELGIPLDYTMFPMYLSHEQIDYIIHISQGSIESSQGKIMLKTLRKRQEKGTTEDNFTKMSHLNQITDQDNIVSLMRQAFPTGVISEEIIKKFELIYIKYESLMKRTLERKGESVHLNKIVTEIKKKIIIAEKNTTINSKGKHDDERNVLRCLMGNDKQREYYKDLLMIRNRLKEIDAEIIKVSREEQDKYMKDYCKKTKHDMHSVLNTDPKGHEMFHNVFSAMFGMI